MPDTKQGWWWPNNSLRRHYMLDRRSLCGKWACVGTPRDLKDGSDEDASPNNCKACGQRAATIRKRQQKQKEKANVSTGSN